MLPAGVISAVVRFHNAPLTEVSPALHLTSSATSIPTITSNPRPLRPTGLSGGGRSGSVGSGTRLPLAQHPPPPSSLLASPSPSPSPRDLVAMTTCNQWHLTDVALTNLASLVDPIDVVIIDDASEDGTAERAKQRGATVIEVRGHVPLFITRRLIDRIKRGVAQVRFRPPGHDLG